MPKYKHTQIGWGLMIIFSAILILGLLQGYLGNALGFKARVVFIFSVWLLVLIMFSTLTIIIDEKYLRLKFGLISFPRKKYELTAIESCEKLKSIAFGILLGIHYGRGRAIYNISGPYVVELTMKNGNRIRIGTDEPDELKNAIEESISRGGF